LTDELAIELVDEPRIAGAEVGLIGRRELLRNRLEVDSVRPGSLDGRPGSRRLVRRPSAQDGDEQPGSEGQHRCRTGRRGTVMLVPRPKRRHVWDAGVFDGGLGVPEGIGG
jgi:hypothetical protein